MPESVASSTNQPALAPLPFVPRRHRTRSACPAYLAESVSATTTGTNPPLAPDHAKRPASGFRESGAPVELSVAL